MGVDVDGMEGFVEANRGSTGTVIRAYEEELERMIDLRRERMGEFIANARTEIESLWEELMVRDEQRDDFAAFVDGELLFPPRLRTCNLMKVNTDEHTEDLLSQREHEIARLKAEVWLRMPLLTSIRKYIEICEENELEREAIDQTRFLGRAGDEILEDCFGKRRCERGWGRRSPRFVNFRSSYRVLQFNMLPTARTTTTFITAHMGEKERTVIPRAWRKHAAAAYGECIME